MCYNYMSTINIVYTDIPQGMYHKINGCEPFTAKTKLLK